MIISSTAYGARAARQGCTADNDRGNGIQFEKQPGVTGADGIQA